MVKKLKAIYQRTTYLNTFDLPHGKNLMPFSLKNIPRWYIDHFFYELQIRFRLKFISLYDSKVLKLIKSHQLKELHKFSSSISGSQLKYFAPSPHPRAGIGHQMSSVLAGMELASKSGLIFAFSGLPNDWAIEMGFEIDNQLMEVDIEKQIRLAPLNFEVEEEYTNHLLMLLKENYSKSVLFWGPLNDSKVDLTYGGKLLQEQYVEINAKDRPGRESLVVHVRRARKGDLGATIPLRNLPSNLYIQKVVEVVKTELFKKNVKRIILLGTDLEELNQLEIQLEEITGCEVISTMGCCDIGAFRLLATSEIMIGSRSGFSYTAGLVNPGKVYFPREFWHKVPNHWELF